MRPFDSRIIFCYHASMTNHKSSPVLPRGVLKLLLRMPIGLYHAHLGGLLGGRFLLLTHTGRKTGKLHQTVLEVVDYERETGTYFAASGWGDRSQWYQNIIANPRVTVQVRNHAFPAVAERVSAQEGARLIPIYAHKHPLAMRELARVMHYPVEGSEASLCAFGEQVPIFAFHPVSRTT